MQIFIDDILVFSDVFANIDFQFKTLEHSIAGFSQINWIETNIFLFYINRRIFTKRTKEKLPNSLIPIPNHVQCTADAGKCKIAKANTLATKLSCGGPIKAPAKHSTQQAAGAKAIHTRGHAQNTLSQRYNGNCLQHLINKATIMIVTMKMNVNSG